MHPLSKPTLIVATLLVLAGTAAAYLVGAQARTSSPNSTVQLRDVAVARGDLVLKLHAAGTLIGTSLEVPVNAQASGIVTWLPANGAVVSRGQPLFRLDNRPALLLYGPTPP